jgi:hypothetical protein
VQLAAQAGRAEGGGVAVRADADERAAGDALLAAVRELAEAAAEAEGNADLAARLGAATAFEES